MRTDRFRSYGKALSVRQYAHEPERFDFKGNPEHLKRLHRIVGNVPWAGGKAHAGVS